MNLQSLKTRIRSLVDDPDGTYATDGFLNPLINQKYEELYNRLLATGAEFERKRVELFNVPAQTSDLSAYDAPTKELELLMQPIGLDYKQTGTAPTNYRTASLVDKVSDFTAGQSIPEWEWRAGIIYVIPSALVNDIRISGDFIFSVLQSDTDPITVAKNFGHVLAYGVSALVGTVRGNTPWQQTYTNLQEGAFDDVAQALTRADQQKIRRLGRMSRRKSVRHVVSR